MTRLSAASVPVVILAGGMGTRLREETEHLPKPLLSIGEQPILWHIMKVYGHFGHRRFILCLGYKSWLIKQYFLNYREQISDFTVGLKGEQSPVFHDGANTEDWEVTCAETGLLTGTGGRISRIRDHVDSDVFMLTYGDGIGRMDLAGLLEFHQGHDRIGTVTGVHPTSRYGEMRSEGSKVVEFNEKPTQPEGFVSGGFFVFDRGIFDYLTDDVDLFFEKEPLQMLARDGELAVFPHDGYWLGMDTYRDYTELNDLWRGGNPPWRIWSD